MYQQLWEFIIRKFWNLYQGVLKFFPQKRKKFENILKLYIDFYQSLWQFIPLFALGCNSNIIRKLGDFIKFYGKIPDILVLITGHFGLFKTPDSQTWGSGYNSNTKPNTAIKHLKNRFQKCPKNYKKVFCQNKYN